MTDMLYRSIEWYAKTAESMIDLLNGMQKWRNDDRPVEWYVRMTESIDHPRHDIDTETTDMRYSSIEWCAKMVESMTDLLNGV